MLAFENPRTSILFPLIVQSSAALAEEARLQALDGEFTLGVKSWNVPNETCNPFPYPLDMDPRDTMIDQLPYYPANAFTDYAPADPLTVPEHFLHKIVRLR